MKDFIKWLGVNEKVAKVAVWMLIILVTLIIINTALNSLGFPHYAITYDNLKEVEINEVFNFLSSIVVCILNFYAIVLLIFRINNAKQLFKYAIVYMVLNCLISATLGYVAVQIFIFLFFIIFSYLYSGKNWKYLLYGLGAILVNIFIQGIAYYFKANFIDISEISRFTRSLLSIDYFIIIGIIIVVKEIYLRKRGEKHELVSRKSTMVGKVQQRKPTSKKAS